jgi:hypothetical protein
MENFLSIGAPFEIGKVGVPVSAEEGHLKKEHGRSPYGWGASEDRKDHFCRHRLNQKKKGGAEEGCKRKNNAAQVHGVSLSVYSL